MPESLGSANDIPIPPLPELSLGQRERMRRNESLRAPPAGPRPRVSMADIQKQTSEFSTDAQSTSPTWLLPPHLTLFYKKREAPMLPSDTIKQCVIDSLRLHDAVFIVVIRKNIGIPTAWLAALEELKSKLSPDIDFDFMFIPSGTDETIAGLYVDGGYLAIQLDHDNNICTTDDALIAGLELCVSRMVSPIHRRCRAVQKDTERAATIPPDVIPAAVPEPSLPCISEAPPKKPIRTVDASDVFLAQWDAEARADNAAANKVRLAAVRSTSRL